MVAKLWAKQIEQKIKTYSQVPRQLKEQVKEILIHDGYGHLVTE